MRKMFKTSIAILSLALAGSVTVFAQGVPDKTQTPADQSQPAGTPGDHHRGFRHHGPNPEFETKMLTKRLSLSSEQAAQIEPILAAGHEQMKALRPTGDAKPDFKVIQEQRKSIMTETNTKVEAILTPEQKEKFVAMHEHHGPGGPHGDWKQHTAGASGGN